MKLLASNCLAIVGCSCIVYGAGLLHPALAFLTGGSFALLASVRLLTRK